MGNRRNQCGTTPLDTPKKYLNSLFEFLNPNSMIKLKEKGFRVGNSLMQKVQKLSVGRLLAIFLLLIASWVWDNGTLTFSFQLVREC